MKNFISNILPDRDKLMHMILCTYIYAFNSQIVDNWIALLIAISVAILIEVYDTTTRNIQRDSQACKFNLQDNA
ncbi:MAG: hypothetical protein PHI32_07975 [Dysgonamonadaceae bacterium]|nr:hypothetical protein [Dysgonamonadaceae bacterium]